MPDTLAICGTSRLINPLELKGKEVWSVGRTSLVGANRYYEFHGLPCREPRFSSVQPEAIEGLPMANSICYMLAQAIWEARFAKIELIATPLSTGPERLDQRPAVAFICGIAKAKGIEVSWEGGPPIDGTRRYMQEEGYGR